MKVKTKVKAGSVVLGRLTSRRRGAVDRPIAVVSVTVGARTAPLTAPIHPNPREASP